MLEIARKPVPPDKSILLPSKKPLRMQKARYCAACGFGKEDFTSPDTKPLVERRPELFTNKN